MSQMKSVAVIGGGAAGLCAARHLFHFNKGILLKPVVFEQRDVIGGTWVYEDIDRNKPEEVFSSLYLNMRTNLPKQTMMFPDFPYPDHLPSYMHHTDVRKYLNDYADHYGLIDFVRFNMEVVNVSPILDAISDTSDNRFVKWNVKSKDKITKETVNEEYDAVVVCNGHYSVPAYPPIKGLRNFTGEIIHSHYYRRPSDFSGLDIVILGSGPSGVDIMVELAACCPNVYFSHRGPRSLSKLPENVIEHHNISQVNKHGKFVFEDASCVHTDVFIPCTGYLLHFPFLSPDCKIILEGNTLKTLYKHLFSFTYPSMSFIGIPGLITPFPLFHQQCGLVASVLSEVKRLPSTSEMSQHTENDRLTRLAAGEPPNYFHVLGDNQFAYNTELAIMSGIPANPPLIENLFKYATSRRFTDACNFKNDEFRKLNDSEFELVS